MSGGEFRRVAVGIGGRRGEPIARAGRRRQAEGESRVAARVGRYRGRAEITLSVAVQGHVRLGAGVEIERERRAGRAVQCAGRGGRGAGVGREDDGVILQVVRPREDVAGMVERDAVFAEVDAQKSIAEDGVGADRVPRGACVGHRNAVLLVERDHVAEGAADHVIASARRDKDAVAGIGQRRGAAGARADEIAHHGVPIRAAAKDLHAGSAVARDEVARARR